MKNIYNAKLVCFAIVFVFIILHQISFAQSQKSVSEILDENGRIKSGVNGSYNASGYTLDYGKNKEPVFKKSNSLQKVSTITWSALGSGTVGVGATVRAIAVSGSNVYVGGDFTTAGGSSANYIALWNGSAWSALGVGVNASVYAIAVSGTDLYVGGTFTSAGGSSAYYIAKWSGSAWSALGTGLGAAVNNVVYAIAVSGTDVYVGGVFTTANGAITTVNNIAKWSGSTWSALGSGFSSGVPSAIAVSGSNVLYVGGNLGGGNYILKWNGSAWSALGTGVSNASQVNAVAVSGTNVYVGGNFTTAGSNPASNIAKWDTTTSTWSALGTGVASGSIVSAIAVSGTDVYVGGNFTSPGNYIAKWDGAAWSALGTGTSAVVNAMAVNTNAGAMMVGGAFATADGTTVNYIAKFTDSGNPLPIELQSLSAASTSSATIELKWETATEVNNYGFEIEKQVGSKEYGVSSKENRWMKIGFVEGSGNSNSPEYYSFVDDKVSYGKPCLPAGRYAYRLKQIDNNGKFKYSNEIEVDMGMSTEFSLAQNYPNPFNPTTNIQYSVGSQPDGRTGMQFVTLKVYDVLGSEVAVLVNEDEQAGSYNVVFNASHLASGIYYYTLRAGNYTETKKLLLLK